MPHNLLPTLAAVAVLASASGCGDEAGSGDTSHEPTPAPGGVVSPGHGAAPQAAEMEGRDSFVQHCGSCHTLEAAGTIGQIGPTLSDIPLTEADVLRAIRTGGGPGSHGAGGRTGNMPRNLVTGKEAQRVAALVSANGTVRERRNATDGENRV